MQCCEGEHWFPFDVEEEPPAPTIDVDADGIWVRRHRFSWTNESDESGFVESAFAAVRVGRIVTTIDVPLIKSGARVATVDDFERIVQTLAARAAEVQE